LSLILNNPWAIVASTTGQREFKLARSTGSRGMQKVEFWVGKKGDPKSQIILTFLVTILITFVTQPVGGF
jgi:hypothetical protein